MDDSTKKILLLAGLGVAGYFVYRAMKARPSAETVLALGHLSAEELESKGEELAREAAAQTKKAEEAAAVGDTSAAKAAEAAAAVAKAEVRVVSAAVIANRKKTAEYGTENVKAYQKVINTVVKAMDGSFSGLRKEAGLYSLVPDGKWGPKTKGASDAFIHLCDLASGLTFDDDKVNDLYTQGKLPFLVKAEALSQTPDSSGVISRESTEKAFVVNSGALLAIPFLPDEAEVFASAVAAQSSNS